MPYRSVNPATGEVITTFANHTDAELQSALCVANSLYKSDWSDGPIQPRLEVRLADLLDCRTEELARILAQEMGKRISEARSEVQLTAEIAHFYATNAATFLAPAKIQTPQGDAWVEYHPPLRSAKSCSNRAVRTVRSWSCSRARSRSFPTGILSKETNDGQVATRSKYE